VSEKKKLQRKKSGGARKKVSKFQTAASNIVPTIGNKGHRNSLLQSTATLRLFKGGLFGRNLEILL